MQKIVILGAGMVGKAIAVDLAKDYDVTATDIKGEALNPLSAGYGIKTSQFDVRDTAALSEAIRPFDLVISAVPGYLGWHTIQTVITGGKNLVDISFLPEDPLPLDDLARAHQVTAIVDCGVAPGIPNIMAGYHYERATIHRFEYMVGGLPFIRTHPFEYKAPFSPCDVLEEYTRPARFVQNGIPVTKPALSDPELIEFPQVGTLEAFNSDGLRSLITTLPGIPFMKEKTLRYPGHIDRIRFLRDAGFLDAKPVDVNGITVVPYAVTAEILKKAWCLDDNEPEFTIMRIMLDLEDDKGRREVIYHLFDRRDGQTGLSSMARTTGFTCTAAANLILKSLFTEKGLFPPERIGTTQERFEYILRYLKERNVNIDPTPG